MSDTMETIAQSYRNACNNVSYKAVFGTNAVIDNRMAEAKSDKDSYVSFGTMPEMVYLFRKGDGQWRDKLTQIVDELRQRRLGRPQIASLSSSLAQNMEKEITALLPGLARVWHECYRGRFDALAEETETLGELHRELEAILNDLEADIVKEQESSSNHSVAMLMKAIIDANYADPGLSLAGVSEEFGLPTSNASILFKEETGEKFIDYVLKIRLDHARRMLVETDEPIQSIAEKVGYTHVISFHRAFKKLVGFPPGEYRVIYRAQR